MPVRKREVRSKGRQTVSSLSVVIENEIRPQLQRLLTNQRALDRRVVDVESGLVAIAGVLVDLKNDMGGSLTIVLDKLTKLADKVGAEK